MKRVLEIFGEPLSNGGQEAFIMNMYRSINREKVQFDFYTPFYCDNENLKKEIISLGGRVFTDNGRFTNKGNKKDFINNLRKFLLNNKYEIVHIHSGSSFALCYGAKIAKECGVKKVIIHSHSSGNNRLKKIIIKLLTKKIYLKYVDIYLACSHQAAQYKFPNKIIKNNKYIIVKNGIIVDDFIFNKNDREKYRIKYNLEDNFVLLNVGRMEGQKNQLFLIDIFKNIKKKENKSKLVIVGSGSLEKEIRNKINQFSLNDDVIILKNRNDVNKIMQMCDIFVFPSIFEGLGIVAIEAQASGLYTICSSSLPDDINLTPLCKRISLKNDASYWCNEILKYKKYKRENTKKHIIKHGYNSSDSSKLLEKIYLGD